MISAIGSGITAVIGWIGDVVDALLTGGTTPGALNALLPVFAVGVGVSAVLLGVKLIRSLCWGA